MQPQLPIDVDPDTGIWTTDALPMLYSRAISSRTTTRRSRKRWAATCMQKSSTKPATNRLTRCDKEAKQHRVSGMAVFEHYLQRLSQRGWGLFTITESHPARSHARIELHQSSFVLAQPEKTGKLCYMFAGWFAGAMDWVKDRTGRDNKRPAFEVDRNAMRGGRSSALRVRSVAAGLADR